MDTLRLDIPTIGITGSSGKTTVKEIISSVLETKLKTFKSMGNKNQVSHTKQHAQLIQPWHEAVVLELAMGRKHKGIKHCSYIEPNIGVITNIGSAHFGMLGNSIEATAISKSELIKYMNPDGALLLNNDDENSKLLQTEAFNGEIITVGILNESDYQAFDIQYGKNGMNFKVKYNEKIEAFFIPAFGNHQIINALFAIAIADGLTFTASEINVGLANFKLVNGRGAIHHLQDNIAIIDDAYNANPHSVKAAIDNLLELAKEKKKVVILGTMAELGKLKEEGHRDIGRYLVEKQVDQMFTLGRTADFIAKEAISLGYPAEKISSFLYRKDLHAVLKQKIEPNSMILVKGSHIMKMTKTVQFIRTMLNQNNDNNGD